MSTPLPRMEVTQIHPGLWRWTAPHPDWKPSLDPPGGGGWGQMVGCVYYEAPEAVVLIDPLVPPEGTDDAERFWKALDHDVARLDRAVAVLLGNQWHDRSTQAIYDRYRHRPHGIEVWAHPAARGQVDCPLTHAFEDGPLPGGIQAHPVAAGPFPSEVVLYLPSERALVPADSLIGAGDGRLRVAPARWCGRTPEQQAAYRRDFRPSLRPLLDFPVDVVLPSHGEPVLQDAHRTLAGALDAPAWGE